MYNKLVKTSLNNTVSDIKDWTLIRSSIIGKGDPQTSRMHNISDNIHLQFLRGFKMEHDPFVYLFFIVLVPKNIRHKAI